MGIHETCTEFDELDVHSVVDTRCVACVVGTCTFHNALLIEVVETNIIGAVVGAAREAHVVVLTLAKFEHFVKPVGIHIVAFFEEVFVRGGVVARRKRRVGIFGCCLNVLNKLVGVHYIECVFVYPVNTIVS